MRNDRVPRHLSERFRNPSDLSRVADSLSRNYFGNVLAVAVLALLTMHAAAGAARPPVVHSVDIHVPMPPTAVNVAGARRLAYELHVTNFRTSDVMLEQVEIIDADGGEVLGNLGAAELAVRIGRPGMAGDIADEKTIGPGQRAVIYLWLALREGVETPPLLRHRVTLGLVGDANQRAVVEAELVPVNGAPPVVLGAPLRGGPWVALYDPHMKGGHRTSIYAVNGKARIPARFAIDWKRLEPDGSRARGDGSKITDWHGHGAEVLAVADAVVADARDDMPEAENVRAATGRMPLENASGNYVVLDLGGGRYAFYEHLKHGSVRVKAGDRVAAGEVVGLLGNSGSSSAGPHLHFHVADRNSMLGAEGLPYVFRGFDLLGAYESIGAFARGESWRPASPDEEGTRQRELPGANAVVMFGPGD